MSADREALRPRGAAAARRVAPARNAARGARLAALLLALAAGRGDAQLDCRPDTGARKIPSQLQLFASLPDDTLEPGDVRRARGSILQEYAAFFRRPADLTVVQGKAEALLRRAGGVYEPGLPPMAVVHFTVARDAYDDIEEPVKIGDPAFDSALVDAVERMARAGVAFLMPPGHDTLQMRIDIGIDPSAGLYPMPIARLAPLGTITRPAKIKPTNIYPKWPKDLEDKRVNDDVVVRILIDEDGRPVMDSIKVVEGKHQGYIDAVIAVIPKYHWTPALSGGCPVKQWVQMPFMFHFADR